MARYIAPDNDIDNCGLTYSELQELWLGPCNGSVFNSTEELRAAWARGRILVMKLWGSGARRPQAWWFLGDAASLGLTWPGYFRERSYLYEHNVLSPQERDGLEHEWRTAFDAARGMGARERREPHEHHDIPHELIERWTAARRRRGRRAVTLPAATSEETAAAK